MAQPRYLQVKRVESANQLAMKVASDDEDDAKDHLLEQQHHIMRSSSAYSLASNPESGGPLQVIMTLLEVRDMGVAERKSTCMTSYVGWGVTLCPRPLIVATC